MFVAALDIGGTKTIAAIVRSDGKIVASRNFTTIISNWQEHFSLCTKMLKECQVECGNVSLEGLGINVPGMTDVDRKILRNAVFAGWKNVDVYSYFKKATSIPKIIVENDVNSCAYGELRFGYGDKYKDFLWITVSTGIGGAVVSSGQVVKGAWRCAGEMGHVKVEYENPILCPCGQKGCLEAHGSGTAIARYMREEALSNSYFANETKNMPLDAKTCSVLASQGNHTCKSILKKAATYLGRGISAGINICNPSAVILGGGVASSLPLMVEDIQSVIKESVISTLQGAEILYTKNGYDAAVLGAASLVIDD